MFFSVWNVWNDLPWIQKHSECMELDFFFLNVWFYSLQSGWEEMVFSIFTFLWLWHQHTQLNGKPLLHCTNHQKYVVTKGNWSVKWGTNIKAEPQKCWFSSESVWENQRQPAGFHLKPLEKQLQSLKCHLQNLQLLNVSFGESLALLNGYIYHFCWKK